MLGQISAVMLKAFCEKEIWDSHTLLCPARKTTHTLTYPYKSLWKIEALSQQLKSQVTFTILLNECKGYEVINMLLRFYFFFYVVPWHVACKPNFPDVI